MTGGDRSALARGIPARGPARALVGIGQVLDELRQEFPDISPSKIRFLEAEGLIAPERASSGYRRFAVADIERLRFILTAQRDEYLPLRVIKERLDALSGDGGAGAARVRRRADPQRAARGRPAPTRRCSPSSRTTALFAARGHTEPKR